MDDRDTLPWYRQFWPWFVIFLPASAVVASLYTVSLAVRTTDSLVVESEDGMDVVTERNLAAERRALELDIAANISIDPESGAVTVGVDSGVASDWPTLLALEFSHPTVKARDLTLELTAAMPLADGTPQWAGHFVSPPSGRYYVVLRSGDDWRLAGTWTGEAELILEPTGSADGS